MGNCIFDCIGKKGYEKLTDGDRYQNLFEIPCKSLLDGQDEAPKKLGSFCENKKAILCVNVATK
jgi:hypothetical protein